LVILVFILGGVLASAFDDNCSTVNSDGTSSQC
jgi:hypothetical protein